MKPSSFLLPVALLFPLSFGMMSLFAQTVPDAKESKSATQCGLTLPDAPALLGMRLGMSLEETKAAAPNLGFGRRIRKVNGVSRSLSSSPNEEADGVVNTFLDERLFQIDVLYKSTNKWNGTNEFIREFSRRFDLPEKAWTKAASENHYTLNCQGFLIEAIDQNHIILKDAAADAESRKRADEIAISKSPLQ